MDAENEKPFLTFSPSAVLDVVDGLRNAWSGEDGDHVVGLVVSFGEDADVYFDFDRREWVVIAWTCDENDDDSATVTRAGRVAVFEGTPEDVDSSGGDGLRSAALASFASASGEGVFLVDLGEDEEPATVLEIYGTGLRLVWDAKGLGGN
jgi:hypothetical protein